MMLQTTIRRWAAVVALLALTTLVQARSLQNRLESIIRSTNLGEAKVAFYVLDLSDGLGVAEMNANEPMIPASNMKLVTTAAAAVLFDNDFEFRTRLYVRDGSLIVVGDGDPAFADPKILGAMDMNVENLLARWVETVDKAG
jgi:D-alanyl-D-alanine carboxypeptidase/D-alanyl-D-alanine-endopeptidase (penicillin-binding protein 4)